MNGTPHFEPIFPAHAVERCGATITFSEALPAKAFEKYLERARTIFRNAGFQPLPSPVSFQIDATTGRATPLTGVGPSIFVTSDQATQFFIAQNSLAARTGRYVRWQPFAGQIEEVIVPLVDLYADIVSIQSVQVDYLDRFMWTGTWANLDWRSLIREDGGFVAGRVSSVAGPWHSHSGWFEEVEGVRRLINVNIDLVDFAKSGEPAAPSVGILTLMRDNVVSDAAATRTYENGSSVQAGLEELHNDLKILLGQIITDAAAKRVALNVERTNAARH
jgi:uncharacterized protein (TIGR04255 family)